MPSGCATILSSFVLGFYISWILSLLHGHSLGSLAEALKISAFYPPDKVHRHQLMNTTTTGASNVDIWRPSWERQPEISDRLRPYSTAAVVNDERRQRPELWDICNGCILWLPAKEEVGEVLGPRLSSSGPGVFNHPILVLDIQISDPRAATVKFAPIRARYLESTNPAFRDGYLPIFPAKPHPNSNILLRLENESPKRGMIEKSCVSIREGVFSLDFRALRCYSAGQKADGYRQRLTKESFDQLLRELNRSSSPWIETAALWEEFLEKHIPTATAETSRVSF